MAGSVNKVLCRQLGKDPDSRSFPTAAGRKIQLARRKRNDRAARRKKSRWQNVVIYEKNREVASATARRRKSVYRGGMQFANMTYHGAQKIARWCFRVPGRDDHAEGRGVAAGLARGGAGLWRDGGGFSGGADRRNARPQRRVRHRFDDE